MPRRFNKRKSGVGLVAALATTVAFVGGWEGLERKAYRDVVGVWTVCYGETRGVQPGATYTKEQCDEMLVSGLEEFEARLEKCVVDYRELPEGMKIAMLSWSYNVGTGAACRSTLVRKANAGDLVGACRQLPRWNKAGGRIWRGLTNRRLSEQKMCLQAVKEHKDA